MTERRNIKEECGEIEAGARQRSHGEEREKNLRHPANLKRPEHERGGDGSFDTSRTNPFEERVRRGGESDSRKDCVRHSLSEKNTTGSPRSHRDESEHVALLE